MHTKTTRITLAVFIYLLITSLCVLVATPVEASRMMRCTGHIVQTGDFVSEVVGNCGRPVSDIMAVDTYGNMIRHIVFKKRQYVYSLIFTNGVLTTLISRIVR